MRILIGMVAIVSVLGAGVAMAGDACCAGVKADANACSSVAMSNLVVKLSLTDEQAAKVKGICAKYSQGECTATTASNCMVEVGKVLTPEQAAKFKAMCEVRACPIRKSE
jgi:hypothetical protein